MVTETNRVWAQGAEPGDAPISSVVVPVPVDEVERREARERIISFVRAPRPAGPNGGPLQVLWDLAKTLNVK